MATIREQLLARSRSTAPALRWREDGEVHEWSWREYVLAAAQSAAALESRLDPGRPPHVGVLLGNGRAMAVHLAAAGLGGHVLVGLNDTRRGPALAADVARSDCQFVITDEPHLDLLCDVDPALVHLTPGDPLPAGHHRSGALPEPARSLSPTETSLFMLIFTSGTSGEPKAVRITHEKVTYPGLYLTDKLGLTGEDVYYVSMPLFHSNGVMAGWAPALHTGGCTAVAGFSASGFLRDVRDFGATYADYVGKPLAYILATPQRPDDADNPLRLVYGNEAGDRDIDEFGRRFGCTVIDGFGSTENAVVVSRIPGTPPGSLGQPAAGVAVLDPESRIERPRADYDESGAVTNLDECVGELVNTSGTGQFAGYYNDEAATAARMRDGMYWSGDLGYRDKEGWVFYAGRTSDWLRVDGENLAAAPIERILLRHPSISEAAVYAVPDPASGDRLMVALVLRGPLDPAGFASFLADQDDLGAKSWPGLVRICDAIPRTRTNKVLKRTLRAEGAAPASWVRGERDRTYRES